MATPTPRSQRVVEKFHHEYRGRNVRIERRAGQSNFIARVFLGKKMRNKSTGTDDFRKAIRVAESWVRALLEARRSGMGFGFEDDPVVEQVYREYLRTITKEGKRTDAEAKWAVCADFFEDKRISEVTSKTIEEFVEWRRARARRERQIELSGSTLHKNLVLLRQMLKLARRRGYIPVLPEMAKQDVVHNPRPWLEKHEWNALRGYAEVRRNEVRGNKKLYRLRADLYDAMVIQFHGMLRVSELHKVRLRDCRIVEDGGGKKNSYLELMVNGKTGLRKVIAYVPAVHAFKRVLVRNDPRPDDLLFPKTFREQFRVLLKECGLYLDANGRRRNMKSIRSTGIALRLMRRPDLNLQLLARNCGTSLTMLNNFYLKQLQVDHGVDELRE